MNRPIFIKSLQLVVKYFAPIIASWTLTCCPIAWNCSNIRRYRFLGKYVTKKFSRNTFLVSDCIFKVESNQRYIVWKRKNHLEAPEKVICVVYLHLFLFRMHERDTGIEKEFGTITDDTRTRPKSEIYAKH